MTFTDDLAQLVINISSRNEGGSRVVQQRGKRPPLVSVIVVAFRDKEEVEALIDNIGPFRGPDVELVIIDGDSRDGTLELLRARNDVVDYWVSEPDRGIYEAMNKGIAAAHGEYILHLNAGDRLRMVPALELEICLREKVDVASFLVQLDEGKVHTPRSASLIRVTNTWHHQGTFYRRSAHLGYDPSYRVFGDFDHNQRMAKATNSVRIFPRVISSHKNAGRSASKENFGEIYKSIRRNSGVIYLPIAFLRFKVDGMRKRFAKLLRRGSHKAG
jgi:glycosyltransferase involved in cell wall biosynthesis